MAAEWRRAVVADAAAVARLAAAVLGGYGEDEAIYAERIALEPEGCFVLAAGDRVLGHCIGHRWAGPAPALNQPIGMLPASPDHWYLHDVAVDPAARGGGAVAAVLPLVLRAAAMRGLCEMRLVAVGGAEGFWARHGFASTGPPSGFGADAVAMVRRLPA